MKNERKGKVSIKGNRKLPLVSIVIPNFNGRGYLEKCIPSVLKNNYKNIEIIIVDNGSSDKSVEFVREKFHKISLIMNKTNLGFVAVNQGIGISKGDYIFVLNNDTEMDSNLIEQLVETCENDPSIGLCQPKITSSTKPGYLDAMGHLIYPDGMAIPGGRLEKDYGQYSVIEEILLPSGCAAFYRKKMLDEVGLYDDDYFAYGEDVDLGFRARLMAWKAVRVPSVSVYHYGSGTAGYSTPLKAYYVERNRLWFAIKCFPPCMLILSPFYTFWRYLAQFWGALRGIGMAGDFVKKQSMLKLVIIILRLHWDTLLNLKRLLRKRRDIRKSVKVSKKEMKEWFKKYRLPLKSLMTQS